MSDDLSIPTPGYRGNRAGRYGTGKSHTRPGMDPDTRRLLMFAGGLGAVLATLIGTSAIISHRGSSEVPVVSADPRPIRIKPDNPGGMKIDGAENDVFSAGADTTDSKLAPTSENPDRKALRTASASPPPVIAPPVIASPVTAPAVTSPPITASPPIPPPAPINRQAAAVNPGRSAPTAPSPAPVAVAHPPATHAPETHLVTTGTTVQLAALTSEEAARNEWQQMAKRMPDLLNGRQPIYARTERDGHVFWRVRTAGFADISQARGFCDRVRAKGGDCSVAEF